VPDEGLVWPDAGAVEAGVVAGSDDGGTEDGGSEDGGVDDGGVDDGGSDDGGVDDGGAEDDGGVDDGGVDDGGAEDDGGLDEAGADSVGWPDPDPEPVGWPGAEPVEPEVIGVGARLVLELEPGALRNALGDRDFEGDAPGPVGKAAPRAGAVAWPPAVACGWAWPAVGVWFAPIRANAASADPITTPPVRPAEASGREMR